MKGDAAFIEEQFTSYLMKTISIRDTNVQKAKKENFYHGILVEIEKLKIGIVIELKYAERNALDTGCAEALQQIEKNNYAETLLADGMTTIFKYGIACYKKHCKVVWG